MCVKARDLGDEHRILKKILLKNNKGSVMASKEVWTGTNYV